MAVFHLLLYWLVSARLTVQEKTTTPSLFTRTRPDCPGKCGDVRVPYPFGIGSNCSLNILPGFDLYCNTSTQKHQLLLQVPQVGQSYRVVKIMKSHIRIKNPIYASRCKKDRYIPTNNLTMDFTGSPYTLSQLNSVTQVGCTDLIVLEGFAINHNSDGNMTQSDFAMGCISFCYSNNFSANGSCPGNACCQIPVPKGTVFLNTSFSGLPNQWEKVQDNSCSYSFLGEKDNATSRAVSELYKPNLTRFTWFKNRTVVLDWKIGTGRCRQARNSTHYACQTNSLCVDPGTRIGGYRCRCSPGYQGNPYLPPGCQDIDECKGDPNPCHVTAICTNTLGGYICECATGYLGNGWRNTSGCLAITMPSPKMSKVSIGLISIMGFSTLLSLSFVLAKFLTKRKSKRRRENFFKENGGLLLKQQTSVNDGILGKIRIFTAKELDKATDRFNESRILGRGGQGTVYKGMLSDGQTVAIKKSQLVDERKSKYVVEQFINEVVILSQVNHRNVVKLLGCCLETKVPLLVYEYVHNGTLHHHLHEDKNTDQFLFLWNMRLKFAADVAGALAYLHSATSLPIFHRDIKSSNILLDEKYVAKVSDFGTSKSVAVDQTHLTTNVNGTFGYIDPEYFQSNQFTEKSDVYSFGVVLAELVTGLKPIITSPETENEQKSLVLVFLLSMSENKLDSILDDRVSRQGEMESVVAVAKLARRCLNLNGKERPNMREVAMELENLRFAQMGVTAANTKLSEDSSADNDEIMIPLTGDNNYNGTAGAFDFHTNSFSDSFPIMFGKELRQ